MPGIAFAAQFFGGVFIANAVPHLVAGTLGKRLQTPFASPPFRGLSSPRVNVLWALTNFALGYLLLVRVAPFDWRSATEAGATFAGFGVWALMCARSFARLREMDGR